MFFEFNSFSFMGFPDSLEKDSHATECNFLSRPTLEFQGKNERVSEVYCNEKQVRSGVLLSSLKVKLPEVRGVLVDEGEEGCTTPTSLDHKIAQVCPPAPRKPKAVPSTDRKSCRRRRVLLDLSKEIESMFPPALLADFGNKIKKVRKESVII